MSSAELDERETREADADRDPIAAQDSREHAAQFATAAMELESVRADLSLTEVGQMLIAQNEALQRAHEEEKRRIERRLRRPPRRAAVDDARGAAARRGGVGARLRIGGAQQPELVAGRAAAVQPPMGRSTSGGMSSGSASLKLSPHASRDGLGALAGSGPVSPRAFSPVDLQPLRATHARLKDATERLRAQKAALEERCAAVRRERAEWGERQGEQAAGAAARLELLDQRAQAQQAQLGHVRAEAERLGGLLRAAQARHLTARQRARTLSAATSSMLASAPGVPQGLSPEGIGAPPAASPPCAPPAAAPAAATSLARATEAAEPGKHALVNDLIADFFDALERAASQSRRRARGAARGASHPHSPALLFS